MDQPVGHYIIAPAGFLMSHLGYKNHSQKPLKDDKIKVIGIEQIRWSYSMLYIILGIIMVFWAWMQAAAGQLQKHKKEARAQWVRVDALLQSRAELVLELLELAREKGLEAGDLAAEIYELQGGYCVSVDREVISACAEEATPLVDDFLKAAKDYTPLAETEEFRELLSGLRETEDEIELQSQRYNHFIELYNAHREKPLLRPQVMLLGAIPLKGFHLRPTEETAE